MTNLTQGVHCQDYFYPADKIKASIDAEGWLKIISGLAPAFDDAIRALDKKKTHSDCPMHGGKKDFRFYKDADQTGGAVCSCGSWPSGYALLMHYHGWSYDDCKEAIAEFFSIEAKPLKKEQASKTEKPSAPQPQPSKLSQETKSTEYDDVLANSSEEDSGDVYSEMAAYEAMMSQPAPSAVTEEKADSTPIDNANDSVSTPKLEDIKKNKPWLDRSAEALEKRRKIREVNQDKIAEKLKTTWNECVPLTDAKAGPARKYLEFRKLTLRGLRLDNDLKFHPSLAYHDEDGKKIGDFPALVAAFRSPNGNIVTFHRTYLAQSGRKASVEKAKKVMAFPDHLEMAGGSIRFGEPVNGVIGIAEGIETALSGFRASKISTWPIYSAALIPSFEPPEGVHTVIHWKDKDRSLAGDKADEKLRENLESKGIRVVTLTPPIPVPEGKKGVDWNDVLMTQGLFGFPRLDSILKQINNASNGGNTYARAV